MKKIVLTDLDNTLLDFGPHFEDWAESQGHRIKRGVINKTYLFEDMFLDPINVEEMLQPFFGCFHTMGNFPALANTVEPIQRLRERGYEFVGITACSPLDGLDKVRHENLKNLFGFDFEEVHVTGYDFSKSDVLKRYEPTIWVEDNIKHAFEGATLGHNVFLINRDYNRGIDGPFTRVDNWLAIEDHICRTGD
jgi:hypothetical protein